MWTFIGVFYVSSVIIGFFGWGFFEYLQRKNSEDLTIGDLYDVDSYSKDLFYVLTFFPIVNSVFSLIFLVVLICIVLYFLIMRIKVINKLIKKIESIKLN